MMIVMTLIRKLMMNDDDNGGDYDIQNYDDTI